MVALKKIPFTKYGYYIYRNQFNGYKSIVQFVHDMNVYRMSFLQTEDKSNLQFYSLPENN